VRFRHPERVLTSGSDVCRIALLDEPAVNQAGHLELVLDDQDAHAHILAGPSMRER
jgi:hypothetical protein